MANPAVGRIRCPICDGDAEVRRYKGSDRGKLYWACGCGQIRPALAVGQAYIERNMRALDVPPPEPANDPPAAPPKPETKPAPAAARKSSWTIL
ncbi:MAG TPA: hypothetical protein VFM56_10665 [Solimonas sp.]|nr:hypothetical protein [Solimonas sp.]